VYEPLLVDLKRAPKAEDFPDDAHEDARRLRLQPWIDCVLRGLERYHNTRELYAFIVKGFGKLSFNDRATVCAHCMLCAA
jgi:hypothetical protein